MTVAELKQTMANDDSRDVDDALNAAGKDVYFECERKDWTPYRLPKPQVIYWAVEQAQGKIDNGGFQYFFEADWPQKPPYEVFINSFNWVGALNGARCLARAVALFPFPEPHLYYQRRREFIDECAVRDGKYNSAFDKLGHEMMDLSDENYGKLGAYVRLNLDAFPMAKAILTQK